MHTGGGEGGGGSTSCTPYKDFEKLPHKNAIKTTPPHWFYHNPKYPPQKNLPKTRRTPPPGFPTTVHLWPEPWPTKVNTIFVQGTSELLPPLNNNHFFESLGCMVVVHRVWLYCIKHRMLNKINYLPGTMDIGYFWHCCLFVNDNCVCVFSTLQLSHTLFDRYHNGYWSFPEKEIPNKDRLGYFRIVRIGKLSSVMWGKVSLV